MIGVTFIEFPVVIIEKFLSVKETTHKRLR